MAKIAARVMEASRQRDVADYEQLRSEALLIGLAGFTYRAVSLVAHGVMVNPIAATTAERASRGRRTANRCRQRSPTILRSTQESVHA